MGKVHASHTDQLSEIFGSMNPFAEREVCDKLSSEWNDVWQFSSFHGVRPALSQAIEGLELGLSRSASQPRDVADFMRAHSFYVLQKTGEIVALAKALDAAGVEAVFFKGAVLGEQVYGAAKNREFNDIDLLVRPADHEKAADLLEGFGYRPVIADRALRRTFFDYAKQHMFRHSETGSVVDLHWDFVGEVPFPLSVDEAMQNRTTMDLGGAKVPILSRDDLALLLAGHGQKENWASFGWALDFAKFAATYPDFDWARAAARSEARHCLRPLLTAMLLVDRLFGHAIDPDLLQKARLRQAIVGDVDQIVARYLSLLGRVLGDDLMGSFRLCETWLQRAKVWLGILTTRTIGDYEALPMPANLWWIYRLTRPLRLVWRKVIGAPAKPSAFFAARKAMVRSGQGTSDVVS